MPSELVIAGRGLGRKKKVLFDDFSIPFPPDLGDGGDLTLRALITRIVTGEVEAFRLRQERRRLARVLSPEQIEQASGTGRIEAGGREDLKQAVDTDQAVATALQAFEDGLYLVIIDGTEHRDLDAQVFVQPGSRITFIRLVFLAGA